MSVIRATPDLMIKFACENCRCKIAAPHKLVGRPVKCPKCRNVIFVPTPDGPAPLTTKSDLTDAKGKRENADPDLSLLDVPDEYKTENQPLSQDVLFDRTSEDAQELAETEQTGQRRLPWFVDVFLYPASLHGMIYLAIFLIAPVLIGLLERFVLSHVRHYGSVLSLILYALLIGYILFYFAYCVFDSSRGGRRAPNISSEHVPDKADLLSQILLILGCIAICFLPTAAYYIFTKRIDRFFWLLAAGSLFLFPMALLAGVLFDSFDALNPVMIMRSILRTFLAYSGLILSFCILGSLVALIFFLSKNLPVLGYVSKALTLYLLLVAAHLLGGFYWNNKDRLDWGI
ncbi:MAG: hypothetical protein ACYSUC_11230 [Planctomycetota bacterium]